MHNKISSGLSFLSDAKFAATKALQDSNRDAITNLQTWGGKSLVYQIGVCQHAAVKTKKHVKMLHAFPFNSNGQQYQVSNYTNFVNVANGKEQDPPGTSKWNDQEVDVVVQTASRIVAARIPP